MQDSKIVINRCPVEEAIKLINKKWVIQLVRDMFFGKSHFNEFKEDKPNLSNKVLSNCLKDMEKNGLIKKIIDDESTNIEYKLTDKGLSLNKVIYELASFTLVNDLDNKFYDEETKEYIDNLFKTVLNID
ncbi:MAG: helix-turn-helix transcriptional regulator [Methanosphaera sp.]|nr:helix-turn-helix transcriptional regulator [Methanosphaera sp.]MBR3213873.1 helix-turn-helix transcriptional regulator [Methanosphaera sp.]